MANFASTPGLFTPGAASPAAAPSAAVTIYPGFSSTFMQPGTAGNLTWSQTRMNLELYGAGTGMYQAGIKTVILQWAADVYANTAYYPSPTIPNNSAQLVPQLYTAAAQTSPHMGLWLGLPISTALGTDYYTFYEHCGSGSYNTSTLLPFAKTVASELHALYGTAIAGWYIPQEIDTNYTAGSAQANAAATYFQALCSYLHSNFPGIKVAVSPFFSNVLLTPSQFAATIAQLFVTGSASSQPDVIALQSGAGDGSTEALDMTPAQITAYFSAVSSVLAGTGVALWENADMYDEGTGGGPITTARLAASMAAAAPYVSSYTGFSFTSQMSPESLGTASVYNAYLAALMPAAPPGSPPVSPPGAPVVNQWQATFAQPTAFGDSPPALQSVVVPLTPAYLATTGTGNGYSVPGDWLICIVGWNQADALPSVDFGVGDDIHSFWRPGGVSGAAGSSGTSVWYTPNVAREVGYVYVSPNGACSGISVTVLEVSGLGPWDTVTGVFANFANAAASLNLALAAPSAAAFMIAAVTSDNSAAALSFAPSGWTALHTVTASNGVNHLSDAVLTSAYLPTTGVAASVTAPASTTDLSGVIIGVLSNAPSPIPPGSNPAWPHVLWEIALNGGFETPPDRLTWTAAPNRLWSWHESTGPQYQLAQLMSTDGDMQIDNFDGSFSPSNPGGLYYSDALNVNMSFNAPYPYTGVLPWTGINGAAIAQDSAHAFASAPNATAVYSCKVTPDGSTAVPGVQAEMDPVTAGSAYSASAWFYASAGWSAGAQAVIKWYNASSILISTSTVAATAIPAAAWTQVTQLGVTAPPGAVSASIAVQFAGTPSAPFWIAEAALTAGSTAPVTGRVTTGTPVRLRCALGTIGGVAVNRWYVSSRNALAWPEKRNASLWNFADATFSDLWSVVSKSSPTPYRGEIEQDNPGWWWTLDDQPGIGGVLPTSMRNSAVGNTNALNIILSPLGGQPQDNYTITGHNCGADAGGSSVDKLMAVFNVAQNAGWMYGDPQSGLQSAQSGGATTAQPGSASWQQTQVSGNTGSYGWFLSCHDPDFPPLAGGVTVEGWYNHAFWGSGTAGTYPTGMGSETAAAPQAQQPYCPLTLWALTTASAPVAILQLDLSGHVQLITYSGSTPTSHAIYTASDLRSASWHHYAVVLTQTTWTVYIDGGLTAEVSGTAAGMTSAWTWLILNGDMGSAGGGSTSGIVHGGNVSISHFTIYPFLLPASRVMAHFNAALTGFGQIPAPAGVQITFETACYTQDGSTLVGQLYQGRYGGTTPTIPESTNPATAVMSAVVAATAGGYTSGPSAWATTSAWNTWLAAWVAWTGFAPQFALYTSDQLGGELEAAVTSGPGDALVSGYGASTSGTGFFQVSGGTGAAPPAVASSIGDTVSGRIERLLGYGNVTSPRRCIDTAPLLVAAALDIGGQQAGSSINNIVQSDNGFLCVDNVGNLCYRARPHLNADQVAWYIGMDTAAGQIPFTDDITFGNDPARIYNDIAVTPYAPDGSSPPTLTPVNAVAVNAGQQQAGDRPQQVTSYLQSATEMQSATDWLFSAFSYVQRRVSQLTIDAATHPAAWPLVLGINVSDVVQVYDAPLSAPATTGVYRVSHIDRTISFGANGASVEGKVVLTLDSLPPGGYWT